MRRRAQPSIVSNFGPAGHFATTGLSGNSHADVCGPKVWAGTFDDGLLELNRKTGECRRLNMNDGLLLNGISGLCLQGQALWIAYRNGQNGAVGTLNLKSRKFSTFTANLSSTAGANSQPHYNQVQLDEPHQAPNLPVLSMTEGAPGEMWFAVEEKGCSGFVTRLAFGKPFGGFLLTTHITPPWPRIQPVACYCWRNASMTSSAAKNPEAEALLFMITASIRKNPCDFKQGCPPMT